MTLAEPRCTRHRERRVPSAAFRGRDLAERSPKMTTSYASATDPRDRFPLGAAPGPRALGALSRDLAVPGAALARAVVRVLLADPSTLVRAGLRYLLGSAPDVEIVGETGDGLGVARLAAELGTDVVLLDLALPGKSGLEVMHELRSRTPGTRVLVLTLRRSEADVRAALEAGAAGYILKDEDLTDLPAIVRALPSGRLHLSAAVSGVVVQDYLERGRTPAHENALTGRQAEILALVAAGRSSKEVGELLGITLRTVHTHRSRIMRRLHVHTEAGLVHAALRLGLLGRD